MNKKFYITTPIYYVNDKPHIGHAYTTILADVLARYHRTAGEEVFFLTGVDEHGQKVKQAAERRGVSPQAHADEFFPRFQELWKKLNIEYNDFVRTTEERHKKIVQEALKQVYDNGDIYIDEYEGFYSVSEERFISEAEYATGNFHDVKKIKEKNYFFKMSKYQKRLIEYIEKNPSFIQPAHRSNEVLGFLKQPLGDLCISRPKSRMDWGIEIPFDKDYVTYVWFDALINYISIIGYGTNEKNFNKWWPADIHLIGKDILTTHSVYWTTMLFSLGLSLPKVIFAHGWWLVGETKMSKSLGNVINPLDLIDQYGVDALRYYLMREMVLGQDVNFTLESFIKRYNSDLANDYGNLLNRVSGLLEKNFNRCVPQPATPTAEEQSVIDEGKTLPRRVNHLINELKVHEAIDETIQFVGLVNKYIEKQAPWKVAKTDLKSAGRILYTATEALRLSTVLLDPVIPSTCDKVLDILGATGTGTKWGEIRVGTKLKEHGALFPRIEVSLDKQLPKGHQGTIL